MTRGFFVLFFQIDLYILNVVRKAACGCNTAPSSSTRRGTEPSGAENKKKNPLACSGFENMKAKWEPLRNSDLHVLQEGFFSLSKDYQLLVISMLSMCWSELQVMLRCLDKCTVCSCYVAAHSYPVISHINLVFLTAQFLTCMTSI